jgi:hypothetical protein
MQKASLIAILICVLSSCGEGEKMGWLGRKNDVEMSFKQRTARFWEEFKANETEIIRLHEKKESDKVVSIFSAMVNKMAPDMAWQFGRDEITGTYELFLSPEGDRNRQFLSRYWVDSAPAMTHWKFHGSKQPSDINSFKITMFDREIDPKDFYVSAKYNPDTKKADISTYHDCYPGLDKNKRISLAFILLDEALGEYGTEMWIGQIQASDVKPLDAFSINSLKTNIDDMIQMNRLDATLTPDKVWTAYSMKPVRKKNYAPREDVIAGVTSNIRILDDQECLEVMKKNGAEYLYIMIDNSFSEISDIVRQRGFIEDALDSSLSGKQEGWVVGGATGLLNSYLDILVFDGDRSIHTIMETLKAKYPGLKGELRFFSRTKAGIVHRINA